MPTRSSLRKTPRTPPKSPANVAVALFMLPRSAKKQTAKSAGSAAGKRQRQQDSQSVVSGDVSAVLTTDRTAPADPSAADAPGPSRTNPDVIQQVGPLEGDPFTEAGNRSRARSSKVDSPTQATPDSAGPDWARFDTKRALKVLMGESGPPKPEYRI